MTNTTTPVNKGGRPTLQEQALKGVKKSDLAKGLILLKKAFGPAVERMIELQQTTADLSPEKEFKMAMDLTKLYMEMLKADKALIMAEQRASDGDGEVPDADQTPAPVFALFGGKK